MNTQTATTTENTDGMGSIRHAHHEGTPELRTSLNGTSNSTNIMQPENYTEVNMEKLNKFQVCDESGKSIRFSDLYEPSVLLIFIRHFFCGSCKDYVSYISSHQFSVPVKIIGCGDYDLIQEYRKETKCPYPVYADASRQTYAHLGFIECLSQGDRGEYLKSPLTSSLVKVAMHPVQFMRAGNIKQDGGEMLIVDGRIKWLHRMKSSADHASIKVIETAIAK